jgi:hypothetical protein
MYAYENLRSSRARSTWVCYHWIKILDFMALINLVNFQKNAGNDYFKTNVRTKSVRAPRARRQFPRSWFCFFRIFLVGSRRPAMRPGTWRHNFYDSLDTGLRWTPECTIWRFRYLFFPEIHQLQADHATPARSRSKSVGSTSTGFIQHFHITWKWTWRYFDTFKIG